MLIFYFSKLIALMVGDGGLNSYKTILFDGILGLFDV
jgi:hypothetical protein